MVPISRVYPPGTLVVRREDAAFAFGNVMWAFIDVEEITLCYCVCWDAGTQSIIEEDVPHGELIRVGDA